MINMSQEQRDSSPDPRPMSTISSVSQHVHFPPPSRASADRESPETFYPPNGYPEPNVNVTGLYPPNGYPQNGYPVSLSLHSPLPCNPYPTNKPPVNQYPLDNLPNSQYPSESLPESPFPQDRLPENLYPASPPPETHAGDEQERLEQHPEENIDSAT